jgi:signal transduction histidine kinase
VALRAALPDDLPMACADIGMMERILTNLIDNALRYTPAGGAVDIDCRRANGSVHVSISDTGYGIPAGDIPRVTERFYKVKGHYARTAGGTGQGLVIAKRLLELHHATLQIDSMVGRGTTVSFDLPLAPPEDGGPA